MKRCIEDVVSALARLKPPQTVRHWAESRFEFLGEGSDRVVFAIDDDYVLKVSRDFNNEQNRKEISLWEWTRSPLLAQIFFYDEGANWLIQERLPLTPPKKAAGDGRTQLIAALEGKLKIELYDSFDEYVQFVQARYVPGRGNVLYDYGLYYKRDR